MAEYEVRILLAQGEKNLDYSIKEGDVTKWHKREGDSVERNEPLFNFETAKVTFEGVSPVSGFLKQILIGEGETISTKRWDEDQRYTNRVVAIIETADNGEEKSVIQKSTATEAGPLPDVLDTAVPDQISGEKPIPPMSPQVRVSANRMARMLDLSFEDLIVRFKETFPDSRVTERRLDELFEILRTKPTTEQLVEVQTEKPVPQVQASPVLVPAARAKAQELGISEVDLAQIPGSGPEGRVMPEDVECYAGGKVSAPAAKATENQGVPEGMPTSVIVKQPAIRRTIARNLAEAWKKPTAQGTFRCDMVELQRFKREYGDVFGETFGTRLQLPFPFVVALIRVLGRREFPNFNGRWEWQEELDGEDKITTAVVHQYEQVNLGVSFATPRGLVVLVLREADTYDIPELAQALNALGQKAQSNDYTREDQTGESILFNNIGGLRVELPEDLRGVADRFEFIHESGYSILTPAISAEVNLGAIDNDGCARLQICFDHRPIDGEDATNFAFEIYCEMFRVIAELEAILASTQN